MTSSVAGLWRSSKAFPKAKHAPERGHGHCLGFAACLIHYSFLNPSKTIISEKYAQPINEMNWKLRCLQPALFNIKKFFCMTTPDHTSHNQCFKSLVNRLMKFCLIHHINLTFHQPTTTSLNISTIFFAGEIFAQPAGCRKCFPRVCQVPKHRFLCYRNKQTYFSLAKMCCWNDTYFDH